METTTVLLLALICYPKLFDPNKCCKTNWFEITLIKIKKYVNNEIDDTDLMCRLVRHLFVSKQYK